jgi:hypothetical protein
MAIRDGISIELDEERAREEEEARRSRFAGKRKGKAFPQGEPPDGTIRRKPSAVLAVLAIVFIFVVASAYAFFALRQTPPGPKLDIGLEKITFSFCETVNITVVLSNPSNGILREYELGASQKFQLDIKNESGDVVAAYNPQSQPGKTVLAIQPGERVDLGSFQWNQTIEADFGTNVTYIQATPGMYVIRASLYGHPGIWAQRNFVLG